MRAFRWLFFSFVCVLGWYAWAAEPVVEARSPVSPGLWWDSSRSGHGFDIYPIGDQLFVVWYTYDDSGKATWYTAQGKLAADGTMRSPWYKMRWQSGRSVIDRFAGDVVLTAKNREEIDLRFTLNGRTEQWPLKRYRVSAAPAEVDRSGLWWEPARSGYALSLSEFFDATIAVIYAYDSRGEPTWMIGARQRSNAAIDLAAYTGPCPGCPYTTASPVSRGTLDLAISADSASVTPRVLATALAGDFQGARPLAMFSPATREPDRQLARFGDSAALARYLAYGMVFSASPPVVLLPSAPPPSVSVSFSSTNTIEANVDEAARLNTDGEFVYGWDGRNQRIRVAQYRDGALTLHPDVPFAKEVVASVPGPSLAPQLEEGGVYVTADKLVSVAATSVYAQFGVSTVWLTPSYWINGQTVIDIFDRTDPARPKHEYVAEIEGFHVASRRIGNALYVITRAARSASSAGFDLSGYTTSEQRYEFLASRPLERLLPTIRVNGADPVPQVAKEQVFIPPRGSELPRPEVVTITRIPINQPQQRESLAIVGGTTAAYVSEKNIYLASVRYGLSSLPDVYPQAYHSTDVHQVALGTSGIKVAASGTVEGLLDRTGDKASFRFSEHQGKLRIVTVSPNQWGRLGQNRVTVLEPSQQTPGLLRTVAYLPNQQRTNPLGKPNELLYGTRFFGDKLFAVTFKKIDPLYVVDFSVPADPVITGQVELPGFSDYLHILSDKLLLGVGKSAIDAGPSVGDGSFAWYQGLQLSLFDVGDMNRPRVIQQVDIGKRGSDTEVFRHHHGFSMLKQGNGQIEFALPAVLTGTDGSPPSSPDPWASYPQSEAGLLRFGIATATPASARIQALPSLITYKRGASPNAQYYSNWGARSILFGNGPLYFENGKFWTLRSTDNQPQGPF